MVMGRGGVIMLRVLVPLAFKVSIFILMSVHDLFNISQKKNFLGVCLLKNDVSFPNITEREYHSTLCPTD